MISKKTFSILFLFLLCGAANAMNFLRPYDTLITPEVYEDSVFQMTFYGEGGVGNARGYARNGCYTNVLQIYNDKQNAITMLDGFDPLSNIGRKRIAIDTNDCNNQGIFCARGTLNTDWAGAFSAYWFFMPHIFVSAYVPFFQMQLKDVCWQQVNPDPCSLLATELTDDFFCNVCQLGEGLELCGWKRRGVGDLTTFLQWFMDYPQERPLLKNVRLNGRFGLNLPTGKKVDEDKIFAVPFGYDGATGLIFGGGLDLELGYFLRAGIDIELLHLFGHTRHRRIKTNENQTELLLLQKLCVYKDYGITQRFNLYGQLYKLFGGFSFKFGYQFFKHGRDDISFCSDQFSVAVANTACSLQSYTMHHIVLNAIYDFSEHLCEDSTVIPYFSVYGRIPVNGKFSALVPMIGGVISLSF